MRGHQRFVRAGEIRPAMAGARERARAGVLMIFSAAAVFLAAAPAIGAAPTDAPLGFIGRWSLEPRLSRFAEAVTGPAPAAAELSFTRDDGGWIAWTLVEHEADRVEAAEFGEAPLDGTTTRIVVNDAFVPVKALRRGPHAAELLSELAGGSSQSIRIALKDDDHLVIDEVLTSPSGRKTEQHLEFERRKA